MPQLEKASSFTCAGVQSVAICSLPVGPLCSDVGVLIVVGGPQYRVGSHRQFVLLARHLAEAGLAVMRFDVRGMGDAPGDLLNFEQIGDDVGAAITHFIAQTPGLKQVVIWGLCDAASAALFYAHSDPRVRGLVLLNPWVRTEAGLASAYIKHYYAQKLLDPAFWRKLLSGRVAFASSVSGLMGRVRGMWQGKANKVAPTTNEGSLPHRMLAGLRQFQGKVLLVLSSDDLTAQEFIALEKGSRAWQAVLADGRVERRVLQGANHTFSRREWRDQVAEWTLDWMRRI